MDGKSLADEDWERFARAELGRIGRYRPRIKTGNNDLSLNKVDYAIAIGILAVLINL